jgi:uncharacterized protein involved in exopolysaccharide biosynthesis
MSAREIDDNFLDDGSHYADIDLGLLVGVIFRQWLLVGVIVALFVGAGFAYVKVAPRQWQATARVLLDPRDKQIAGPGLAQPVQGIDTFWIDTQADIVRSTATLDAAIDRLNLSEDPEIGGSREETRRKLSEALRVERADQTYVLDINVFTGDPERSARIAEALAESFVDGMIAIKADAVRQASRLIDRQIDELKSSARAAQEKLEAYKREQGLVSANGRLVDEDTLRQLNDSYVAAQVRARDALARRDSLAAALKSGDVGSIDVAGSSIISRLKIENAQASRTLDDLSAQLGPNHPRLIAARADVTRIQTMIAAELKGLAASASRDYDVAAAGEAAAKQAVDAASATVSRAGEAGITLKELENEATIRADMYRNYSARTAEIGLQANTQISDARVIVPASVPLYPYAPRKVIVLGIAAIAGFGLALTLALYRGRRLVVERLMARRARRAEAANDAVDEAEETADAPAPPPSPAVAHLPDVLPIVAEPQEPPANENPEPVEESVGPERPTETPPAEAAPVVAEAVEAAAPAVAEAADPEPAPEAPPIAVLAELSIATRGETRNRLGRLIARGGAEVLRSAVETAPGAPDAAGRDALGKVIRHLARRDGKARRLVTLGVADSAASAAVAYGLADVSADGRAGILLVDASYDETPLWRAFAKEAPAPLVDVVDGGIDAAATAVCDRARDITLLSIGGEDEGARVDAHAAPLASLIDELAADYGRLILHFGHRHSLPLLEALMAGADAVLVVAESLVETDPESKAAIADLAAAIPGFSGMILVDERQPAPALATEAS